MRLEIRAEEFAPPPLRFTPRAGAPIGEWTAWRRLRAEAARAASPPRRIVRLARRGAPAPAAFCFEPPMPACAYEPPIPFAELRRPPAPRVADIKAATAARYGVTVADLEGPRRVDWIVRPRQVAMHLAKTLTLRSLPEIGRRFGGRDHTTVLHGVRKIAALALHDARVAADLAAIKAALGRPETVTFAQWGFV